MTPADTDKRFDFPDWATTGSWLGPDFLRFLAGLQDQFQPRIEAVRAARGLRQKAARAGEMPGPLPPSEATREAWRVPPLPGALCKPGIEISGPASIPHMMIHALNPGPDGERAVGYLDDDEDSAGHSLRDTLHAARNRAAALEGTLSHYDPEKRKEYRVTPGALPFFMHRERGWHLDEPELRLDGRPVSAALLGTALTLFYAGRLHAERGESIHFYLPKTESAQEVRLYREVFDHARRELPQLASVPFRAIVLIESLPAACEMEEMLFALGPYAAGLNAARWDLKASLIEFALHDASQVWPDRFDVDIKTTPFLANLFRRLVAICAKHGAIAIGGMATALPSADEEINRAAAAAITADKTWEAEQGFLRGWVAHIHHMSTAAAPFVKRWKDGFDPAVLARDPTRFPLSIETPKGRVTEHGTRRNLRTLLEYLEGWLGGRGAKGIDSLSGRPGKRPALMEDLATARISVAQTAQRLLHAVRCEDTGRRHGAALVTSILYDELSDIRSRLNASDKDMILRYERACGIARHWIRRYTEFDLRSLGSFSRAELETIGDAVTPL